MMWERGNREGARSKSQIFGHRDRRFCALLAPMGTTEMGETPTKNAECETFIGVFSDFWLTFGDFRMLFRVCASSGSRNAHHRTGEGQKGGLRDYGYPWSFSLLKSKVLKGRGTRTIGVNSRRDTGRGTSIERFAKFLSMFAGFLAVRKLKA